MEVPRADTDGTMFICKYMYNMYTLFKLPNTTHLVNILRVFRLKLVIKFSSDIETK